MCRCSPPKNKSFEKILLTAQVWLLEPPASDCSSRVTMPTLSLMEKTKLCTKICMRDSRLAYCTDIVCRKAIGRLKIFSQPMLFQ